MKNGFKAVCIVVLMLCASQSAFSQLLYPQDPKKDEYLPPYDPNVVIISDDVKKWMDEQAAQPTEKRTVEMNWDISGRVKSSSDNLGQKELKVVDNKQKRLVVVSDMHIRENQIEPEYGRYEYNSETDKRDYSLKGKKVSEKEYLEYLDNDLAKFKNQKRGKRDLFVPGVVSSDNRTWTAWMTAEEISELTKNNKELVIDDYREAVSTASVASILSTIQLSTIGHNRGYKGNGIGVYVMEPGCRDTSVPIVNSSKYTNRCSGTTDTHHSYVVNVVQQAAPLAHVFGFATSSPNPSNPFSYSPPIEIGTHSYCFRSVDILYNVYDANMDNYIYDNRVINFVSAGNRGSCSSTFEVSSPGKALNAITVGAVEPATNSYANYSRWINSEVHNDKPEIAMYTDINMGSYSSNVNFSGTSAATPLAAGFTASLLEQHPFFKRQPALMKAVLLTGETIPIQNASSWDRDNRTAKAITNYSSVAYGTRSAWWNGGNSSHFDANREIKFTENNIQANKRYRIAIAWLVSGSYINSYKVQPQNIDLHVEQNGKIIASSVSERNSFEFVDFTTTSNAPLTVIIKRHANSRTDNVLLGYHMRGNF